MKHVFLTACLGIALLGAGCSPETTAVVQVPSVPTPVIQQGNLGVSNSVTSTPSDQMTTSTAATSVGSLSEADANSTVHVKVGSQFTVVLHSTYWEFSKLTGSVLKQAGEPAVVPVLGGIPGLGKGTVTATYEVMSAGNTDIKASRVSCGEAMLCTGDQGHFVIHVVAE